MACAVLWVGVRKSLLRVGPWGGHALAAEI